MIYFDHCYTSDPGHRFHKRLEKFGFTLEVKQVEHPGKMFCRFIMFAQPGNPRKRTYLEFIRVGPGGEVVHKPGISFGWSAQLKKFYDKIQRDGRFRAKFIHKNYEWKAEPRKRLPGWNFVSFEGLRMRGVYPWMTEYEPHAKRREVVITKHPNGVNRHEGFAMELSAKDKVFFEYILGQKINPVTRMRCGTELYIQDSHRTKVNAVVLKAKSLRGFLNKYGSDSEEEFAGRPAARIRNPSGMWDILIV